MYVIFISIAWKECMKEYNLQFLPSLKILGHHWTSYDVNCWRVKER